MKVLELHAHNVMGVKEVKFDLRGHNLYLIGGKNGQGKTSALKALLIALCGRSGMKDFPEVPLREGEDKGFIDVKLSGERSLHDEVGFTVRFHFKRKVGGGVSEEFELLDSTGDPAGSPRDLLRSLYSMKAFDPLEFERMKPQDQRKLLVDLVELDFTELDKEFKEEYAERTVINKQGVAAKAVFDAMPKFDDAPAEPVDVGDLSKRMKAANDAQREIMLMEQESKAHRFQIQRAEEDIKAITAKIAELQKKHDELVAVVQSAEDHLAALEKRPKPIVEDLEVIQQQMAMASEVNKKVQANKDRAAKQAELADLRKQSEAKTARLKEIEESKVQMIQQAKWPVPGLSLSDDGVLYNGLPFSQINKADRVKISTSIGIALNPTLRLLVCEDGSAMDTDTLEALDEMLKVNDFQMLMEVVTRTNEDEQLCSVVIRNGESYGTENPS